VEGKRGVSHRRGGGLEGRRRPEWSVERARGFRGCFVWEGEQISGDRPCLTSIVFGGGKRCHMPGVVGVKSEIT
jgi:hypothetical protein